MRNLFTRLLYLLVFLFSLALPASSQQTPQEFVQKTGYLLYLPDGYQNDQIKKWPLVLFLHGSGESGNDLEKVKVHGPPKLVAQGRKFPFILVSPQAASPAVGWDVEMLYSMLLEIKQKYRVDPDRIYLTGLSMGGFGTWALAMKHPEEFAAIAPLCGGGDTTDIWKLRHMPVWCFHGALDNAVPIKGEEVLTTSLKRYNPSVRFTVYPDAGHDCWTRTYEKDSLYDWLLGQKKFTHQEMNLSASALNQFTGTFVTENKDTAKVYVERDTLWAIAHGEKTNLIPETRNQFFTNKKSADDFQFFRDEKGNVSQFFFYGRRKMLFRRID